MSHALITRKLGCPVVSLGILADDQPDWRPERYHYSMWGCEVDFRFAAVKLLDYKEHWEELERSDNPFALAVMVQLLTHATQGNFEERKMFKFEMVRRLLERGHDWTTIQKFFRFRNLVMVLPGKLEEQFEGDASRYEKEQEMPVLTQFEKNAMRKGALPVARADVLQVLRARFGRLPRGLAQRVEAISGLPTLRRLLETAATIGSLEEFEAKLPAPR